MKINQLQASWINGQIPLVKNGFYGDKLTIDNIHIKTITKDCDVLVGSKTSGHLTDKQVIDYFMQFVSYPKYRKYIIDTLHKLDNIGEIL